MSNKKKINLKRIKYISLTKVNYVAGSGSSGGLAGEDLEKVSGRYSIAGSASGGGLARGAAEARLSLRSVCFTENRRSRQRPHSMQARKRRRTIVSGIAAKRDMLEMAVSAAALALSIIDSDENKSKNRNTSESKRHCR